MRKKGQNGNLKNIKFVKKKLCGQINQKYEIKKRLSSTANMNFSQKFNK